MSDTTRSEDLLIVTALARLSHAEKSAEPERADRAWQLVGEIAAEYDLEVADAIRQLEWSLD